MPKYYVIIDDRDNVVGMTIMHTPSDNAQDNKDRARTVWADHATQGDDPFMQSVIDSVNVEEVSLVVHCD